MARIDVRHLTSRRVFIGREGMDAIAHPSGRNREHASELTALLTSDVGLWSDGGGKATAARRPLVGRHEVLKFLVGLHRIGENTGLIREASLTIEDINSETAPVLRVAAQMDSIFVLSIDNDAISGIRVVRNPDKLARIRLQLNTLH